MRRSQSTGDAYELIKNRQQAIRSEQTSGSQTKGGEGKEVDEEESADETSLTRSEDTNTSLKVEVVVGPVRSEGTNTKEVGPEIKEVWYIYNTRLTSKKRSSEEVDILHICIKIKKHK